MLIASAWLFRNLAPGIVGIGANRRAGGIDDTDDVSLQIGNVVVQGSIVVERIRLSLIVVEEVHGIAIPGLPGHLTVLGEVIVSCAANGFAIPDARDVVGVADRCPRL